MKKSLILMIIMAALTGGAIAQVPAAAPPATPTFSVATTKIADLLDKPALRAIFEKYLPQIVANPQIDLGRALTLPDIVQYEPDIITPDKLAAIDAELKDLPPQ